ncbi:hypothetical protein VFPPC_17689 [Pochonia chlamydosporia 170]|uniref:Uncharacterized protein n=1 Tax=Pochonia chlamydosporia 170 TaxID=1380566 RepID=A0A219ASE2_METCM|nr:hypothetical protein VFPPC_17689 [Pochonia chlamydosporia 170]OWT43135.1 hypothetical protein VFPPC_17689 [Pochonia chlamydosporia 170]
MSASRRTSTMEHRLHQSIHPMSSFGAETTPLASSSGPRHWSTSSISTKFTQSLSWAGKGLRVRHHVFGCLLHHVDNSSSPFQDPDVVLSLLIITKQGTTRSGSIVRLHCLPQAKEQLYYPSTNHPPPPLA